MPKKESAKARILVIDDDEGMCYTITRMAEEEGHEAQAVYSGDNAIDANELEIED